MGELWLRWCGGSCCGCGVMVGEQCRMCIASLYDTLIMWSDDKHVLMLSDHCSVCSKSGGR